MLKIITILFSVLGSSHLVTVKVLDQRLNVTDGGSATLQCTYTTNIDTRTDLNIQWTFHQANSQQNNQIYYYEGGQSYRLGSFKNRITAATSPNNATITISNMQPSDSGVYVCEVNNPPDFQGNNQGLFFVSVLVEPSKPLCAIHGTPESGHRVSLSCHSQQGNPAPTYTWSKLSDGVARQPLGQMDIITGIMTIGNLSQFETGTYQCNASNSQGFSICTVELSEGAHEGAIVGGVIGAVLAAVIIGTVVWFLSSKRKGKSNKKSTDTELQMKAQGDGSKYQIVPTVEAAPVQAHAVEVQEEEPRGGGEEQETLQNNTSVEA
ncbi:V-set and immunoglobulin domain-containing protein 1-like isoform X1 [Polyodon spathula]|uniref:V-set and immunoglobulin domain-containing protein 1-like isoform X1 n=1 Tax=Polyodon spathula TaxID=7913 RepID=UPI001B7EE821|nr:V-set and immunoglobulin domain-containing protein 1-like isoform X1 [Polyodon spathula]